MVAVSVDSVCDAFNGLVSVGLEATGAGGA